MELVTLTPKEALEQGYLYFVFNKDGYQGLKDIADITEDDFLRDDIRVVQKEPYHPTGLTSKRIAERLADEIEEQHVVESGDDTQQVFNAITEMDFNDVAARIDEVLSKFKYYKATNIQLVANK